MSKLYPVLFIVFFVTDIYAQVNPVAIEPVEITGHKFQFVDKITKEKINDLEWVEAESFQNGFAKVYSGNKWGFVDRTGEQVIKPGYEAVRNFVNHRAAVKQHTKWGFINEKGVVVIPFEFDIVFDFKEPETAVYKDQHWYLINFQGKIVNSIDINNYTGVTNKNTKNPGSVQSGTLQSRSSVILPTPATNKNAGRESTVTDGACPENIGFEYGNFTNWDCYVGTVASAGTTNVVTVAASPPTANRHVLIPATIPSAPDPYGLFPTNPPDGSGFAVKLGNDVNGSKAERISYQFNVPVNAPDASITYRYAVVFQDPGHLTYEQPRFSAKILDVQTNTYLPCASFEYISTSSLPGFENSPVEDIVKFKQWSSVYVNLSQYAGKTLILEFTTADCTRGAHWGYAYIDVGDCNISAGVKYSCNPSQAIFTGPPGFEYYNWWSNDYSQLYGTGETMTILSPPAPGTTIHVEVIPYDGFGCTDTLEVPYTVNLPMANAGPDLSICPGSPVTIGNNVGANFSYSWSPANNLSNSTMATPVVNPQVTTDYFVTVTDNVTGCFSLDTISVLVNPKPVAGFTTDPTQCLAGNNFTFSNTSSVSPGSLTHNWSFSDGGSSTLANPVHSFSTAGPYSIKLVATSNHGCKDSTTKSVVVTANPLVKTNNDLAICRGQGASLLATGAQQYEWLPVQDLSCNMCANPVASPAASTFYIVKGIDNSGCPGYDTVNITVHQPIQVSVSPDRTICSGQSIDLQVSGTASTYNWSPAQSLNDNTITNPVATPLSTTQYRVVGYDNHNCFTDTGYITITVNPTPSIDLGPDLVLSTGTVFPLPSVTQNGPMISWHWSPSTDLSCTTCPEPTGTAKNNITYQVQITNIYNCIANDSIRIRTFCEGAQVFIPNAFSPDGDGVNDILMVRGKGIQSVRSFRIFTRWGELVFEKRNFPPNTASFGWDGKIKGITGAAEVYIYTAEVTCDNLQTFVFKGNTTLLK